MNLNVALTSLRKELLDQYENAVNLNTRFTHRKYILIKKIENVTDKIIKAVARNKAPYLTSIDFKKIDNCVFNERLQLKEVDQRKSKKISFGRLNSRSKFEFLIVLLSKMYKLLASGQTSTRRELFYRNKILFKCQSAVDSAIREICYILEAPSWELGVTATAKGIIAGPLIIKSNDGKIINCNKPEGVLIPQNIQNFELISTTVEWALIVEKDTAFQKILNNNGLSKLKQCLIITVNLFPGKGFPDVSTRLLICRLWECFKIPILALVDADPYGLEIMCVYRFGSITLAQCSDFLACPSVRWLGVHPSDIKFLAMSFTNLSNDDATKISKLIKRPYIKDNKNVRKEIQILLDGNAKADIEGISNISTSYITDVYIPSKILSKQYF